MNMVKSDISRKPLKDFRQSIERTSLKCGSDEVPIVIAFPVHTFELMLHVKQPDTRCAAHGHHCQLNQQVSLPTEEKDHSCRHNQDTQIRPLDGVPFPFARFGGWKALVQQEQEKWGDHKKNKRITGHTVGNALPSVGFHVFLHGHHPDVANSPLVEIPGVRMVPGVFPAPVMVGRKNQYPSDESKDVIGTAGQEKRSVATVVKDNENAHLKTSSQDKRRQGQPDGDLETEIHEAPEKQKGTD